MTLDALLPLLRCPSCGGAFGYERVPQRDAGAGECGILTCGCGAYPVLDGIPILRRGELALRSIADARVHAPGVTTESIRQRIVDGRGLDALADVLTTPLCPWPLRRFGAVRRLSLRQPLRGLGLTARRHLTLRRLARRADLTAEDWLAAFYWHAPVLFDPFNYFFFRFGQPRHLSTLALTSILPESASVLDLACGYGHVLHSLTANGRPGIGLEQNVHQAWLARHYVAPGASFVCADADQPLPFREDAADAVLCTDAFHYFAGKAGVLREMRRCAAGPVLLATVGNDAVPPREGDEFTVDGYTALFGDAVWRACTEADLLARYLDGRAPDLSHSAPPDALAHEKWLSFVVADDEALFHDHGPLDGWPHMAGVKTLNPIYEREDDHFRLRFPSPWFAAENRAMLDYMPVEIDQDTDIERLRARAVRVGLPARYARANGRPMTFFANRTLSRLLHSLRST